MDAATKTHKLGLARKYRDGRIEAEATIELLADELEKAGINTSIGLDLRAPGEDGYSFIDIPDLADPDRIAKALESIRNIFDEWKRQDAGRDLALVFSRLTIPRGCEFGVNLQDSKNRIVGRYVHAYDVIENKQVRRVDCLFKIA